MTADQVVAEVDKHFPKGSTERLRVLQLLAYTEANGNRLAKLSFWVGFLTAAVAAVVVVALIAAVVG